MRGTFHFPLVCMQFLMVQKVLHFFGPKIWELVPDEMNQPESLREFINIMAVETYVLSLQIMQTVCL